MVPFIFSVQRVLFSDQPMGLLISLFHPHSFPSNPPNLRAGSWLLHQPCWKLPLLPAQPVFPTQGRVLLTGKGSRFWVQTALLWSGASPRSLFQVPFLSALPKQTLLPQILRLYFTGYAYISTGLFCQFFSGLSGILKIHLSSSQSLPFPILILGSFGQSPSFTGVIELTTVKGMFTAKERSWLWNLFLTFLYKSKTSSEYVFMFYYNYYFLLQLAAFQLVVSLGEKQYLNLTCYFFSCLKFFIVKNANKQKEKMIPYNPINHT